MSKLDQLILSTQSGKFRNKLSSLNIVISAIENDTDTETIEKMVDAVIRDDELPTTGFMSAESRAENLGRF